MKAKSKGLLLPDIYKRFGLGLILVGILPGMVLKFLDAGLSDFQKELFQTLSLDSLVIGLLLIGLSRDREEDEMSLQNRLLAFLAAFVWAVMYTVLRPFASLLFDGELSSLSAPELVLSMLLFYLIVYYLQKWRRA